MRVAIAILLIVLFYDCESQKNAFRMGGRIAEVKKEPMSYVDVFVGTSSEGHTFPGATSPFGMIQVSPINTVSIVSTSGFDNANRRFFGFVHTCLSGTGIADGLDILISPSTGTRRGNITLSEFISRIELNTVSRDAKPGFFASKVEQNKNLMDLRVVAKNRCAIHRWSSETKNISVVFDLRNRFSWDHVLPGTELKKMNSHTLVGKRCTSGWAEHTCVYFIIRSALPFARCVNGAAYTTNEKRIMICDFFHQRIEFQVGISYVSVQGAMKNLDECNKFTYERALQQSRHHWNEILGKFKGGGKLEMTALYHCLLAPTLISDRDGSVRDPDGVVRVREYNTYSSFSLWDTYRAEMSLLHLILSQHQMDEMIQSLVTFAKHNPPTYSLPLFDLYRQDAHTMIGYPAVSVIANAVLRRGNSLQNKKNDMLTLLKRTATRSNPEARYVSRLTFIPSEIEQSVSKALEMSSSDDCIARVAKQVSDDETLSDEIRDAALEIELHFRKRSRLYKLYFYEGFFRPRLSNGTFVKDFDYLDTSSQYTESNAYQYLFSVTHDVEGLASLLGGKDALSKKLDDFFFGAKSRPHSNRGDLPKDVAAGLFGGASFGNEPSLHIPLLYNYVGKPWKAQFVMHTILTKMFSLNSDGLIGNDDMGALSSFYFFNAALGIYPIHACSGEYQISRPLVQDVTLRLLSKEDDDRLCHGVSPNLLRVQVLNQSITHSMYVQNVWLNENRLNRTFILHEEILRCGTTVLKFLMGPTPNHGAMML